MKRKPHKCLTACMMTLLLGAGMVMADSFTLDWYTIDGGGEMQVMGGPFELSGTIGQCDAMPTAMAGGPFELSGGFWQAAPTCACLSDMNDDGERNAADIQEFVACFLGAGANCECGDLSPDSQVNLIDLELFVRDLLIGDSCP